MAKSRAPLDLILCQGDKAELEAITGEKFEHIPYVEKVHHAAKTKTYIRNIVQPWRIRGTFVDLSVYDNVATESLCWHAHMLKADAVIHYSEIREQEEEGDWMTRIRGTYVRKRR